MDARSGRHRSPFCTRNSNPSPGSRRATRARQRGDHAGDGGCKNDVRNDPGPSKLAAHGPGPEQVTCHATKPVWCEEIARSATSAMCHCARPRVERAIAGGTRRHGGARGHRGDVALQRGHLVDNGEGPGLAGLQRSPVERRQSAGTHLERPGRSRHCKVLCGFPCRHLNSALYVKRRSC